MSESSFTFNKSERLCSTIAIDQVFANGKSFVKFPFRVVVAENEYPVESCVQVLISVSKKRFKRAVKRNLLKRRTREAYRLNKGPLLEAIEAGGKRYSVALLYISNEELPYQDIEKGMKKLIIQLIKTYGVDKQSDSST